MRVAPGALVAAAALATLVATWWLVGDQSEPNGEGPILHFPNPPAWVEAMVGSIAVFVATAATAWLVMEGRVRSLQRGWWVVLVSADAAGILAGVLVRAVTAKTVGANIGGGAVLLGGPSIIVGLALAAGITARRLSEARRVRESTVASDQWQDSWIVMGLVLGVVVVQIFLWSAGTSSEIALVLAAPATFGALAFATFKAIQIVRTRTDWITRLILGVVILLDIPAGLVALLFCPYALIVFFAYIYGGGVKMLAVLIPVCTAGILALCGTRSQSRE